MVSRSEAAEQRAIPAFTTQQLTAFPDDGWISNGGNVYNQRFSPLTEINRANVAQLKGVWHTRLEGSGMGPQYSGEAQPLVYAGVIYVVTGADDVFAISVKTGEILWIYKAELNPEIAPVVCCGWTSRGVAIGDKKVYVGQLDGKLVALDQASGKVVWAIQAERPEEGYTLTSAPLYYDGLVITGFAGAEYATRGRVKAYHAVDGSFAWVFYTVPGPGELGHDTWPQDSDAWKYGGGSVWQTPAVDPELGSIYFATGNPGPDFDGSVRPGDNLFTASVMALDVKTGAYRWHFQQIHHDIWDFDSATPVVLFDIELDGQMRKAIVSTNKNSWVYILDRETGKPLIGIDEQPVPQEPRQATSATQPIPAGGFIVSQEIDIPPLGYKVKNKGRVFTPFWKVEEVLLKFGYAGFTNWPPNSYDPRTNTLYVCAADTSGLYRARDAQSPVPEPGKPFFGGDFQAAPVTPIGIFAALDMKTNRPVWRQSWKAPCYSGSLVTAGGLVFTGQSNGRLLALDSSDGTLLWAFQTGAGMNSPVSSFRYQGAQYVVAYAAGNLFAGSPRGDHVWLFSLRGTLSETSLPEAEDRSNSSAVHETANTAAQRTGREIFELACQACHGLKGEGGRNGTSLRDSGTSDVRNIRSVVMHGREQMPSFGTTLSQEEVNAVSAYVATLVRD